MSEINVATSLNISKNNLLYQIHFIIKLNPKAGNWQLEKCHKIINLIETPEQKS